MLPKGWQRSTIGDCTKLLSGNTPSKENPNYWSGDFPWVTVKDMKTPWLHKTGLTLTPSGKAAASVAPANSVLVVTRGMALLKDLPISLAMRDVAFNQDIKAIVPKDYLDARFFAYQLQSKKHVVLGLVDTAGHGTGKLDTDQLKSVDVVLPPLPEQRRIAHILFTWDEAIVIAERLLVSAHEQSTVLADVLLSGRRRGGHHPPWEPKPISQMICESRVVGSGGDTAKKITVKLYGRGVVGKAEKRIGSESTQYYRRTAGQFIYSKLDFLNGAFGRIPPELDGYESTLDLPAFDFLPGVDPRWFLHFVSRESFYIGHLGLANGGRKARRVNPTDLLRVEIDTPCLEEQQSIADAIDLAKADVVHAKLQVTLLREEKAALMAQLLTGKCRVHLPDVEVEALA